ncbi:MAG: hypothetical protein MZV63_05305 [Marinilabiliales bacterium]|nr:hypothetical protein [Marinilabiliales bacterium]
MTMIALASGFRSAAKDIVVEGTVTDEAGALLMNTRGIILSQCPGSILM